MSKGTAWINLREEIAEMFSLLEGIWVLDLTRFQGWYPHDKYARETPRQPRKTELQRTYDRERRAAEKAARKCRCGGQLGRPYKCQAKCAVCGESCYVAPAKETVARAKKVAA